MALVLTVKEGETITIGEVVHIQVRKKKRAGKEMFSVSIIAPKEVNIARSTCKNKEDNMGRGGG
tara:strand:- start:5 stop:196 length:192 start_codon:yes stop_codon:yes gene_type:complete